MTFSTIFDISAKQILINHRISQGVRFRAIAEEGFFFDPNDAIPPLQEYRENTRVVNQIPIMFIASEKEAGINFPDRKGIFHLSSTFFSDDRSFLGWCEDLFEHYWRSSEPITPEPDISTEEE